MLLFSDLRRHAHIALFDQEHHGERHEKAVNSEKDGGAGVAEIAGDQRRADEHHRQSP